MSSIKRKADNQISKEGESENAKEDDSEDIESENSEDDDEDDIDLEGDVLEADMTRYTFEFRDMKDDYSSDIGRLLGNLVIKKYCWELSHEIAAQGNVWSIGSELYFYINFKSIRGGGNGRSL